MRKKLICIVFFVLPIVILSSIIKTLSYNNLEPLVTVKMEEYAKIKDNIDLVFIGTSTTWRNINTDVFDSEMKKNGRTIQSYNFGIQNMTYGEMLYILKEIGRLKPNKLKYIFLETYVNSHSYIPKLLDTKKFVFWHDLGNTIVSIKRELSLKQSALSQRVYNAYHHLRALYFQLFDRGSGFAYVNYYLPFKGITKRKYSYYKTKIHRGNLSLDDELGENSERHKRITTQKKKYRKTIADLAKKPRRKVKLYNSREFFYKKCMEFSQKRGIRLVFFTSPRLHQYDYTVTTSTGRQYPVLRLNDVHKYPKLYKINRRYDFAHLNARGAREASIILAQLFSKTLDSWKYRSAEKEP